MFRAAAKGTGNVARATGSVVVHGAKTVGNLAKTGFKAVGNMATSKTAHNAGAAVAGAVGKGVETAGSVLKALTTLTARGATKLVTLAAGTTGTKGGARRTRNRRRNRNRSTRRNRTRHHK
jgi:hypothetical protein